MKKDIEWLKEEIGDLPITDTVFISDGVSYVDSAVSVMSVYDLIDQLEESEVLSQELPVIPKYVGDYLEFAKKESSLIEVMETASVVGGWPAMKEEFDWISANDEVFARAWLDGYRLAEEPLYYALLTGHELTLDSYKNLGLYRGTRSPMYISYKHPLNDEFVIKMSKSQWKKLGINDSNANFVKVEELEE